jgi:hypothetical protein
MINPKIKQAMSSIIVGILKSIKAKKIGNIKAGKT